LIAWLALAMSSRSARIISVGDLPAGALARSPPIGTSRL